jgi:phage shock protein C
MISGVCGGIAKYFSVDPTLIRLLFVIFAFAGGPGFLAYIVLAIIVPEEPTGYSSEPPEKTQTEETAEKGSE